MYNLPNNASYHLSSEDLSLIGDEVFRQCDAVDGLADGIIFNPYACDFRPETLVCNSTSTCNSSNCLTSDQIDTVYKYYNDWVDVNQTYVFPAFTYGSEAQFAGAAISSNEPNPSGIAYARYFLYNDPNWPWEDLDYSTVIYADATDPGNATADDFDLRPFMERGGELIHHRGLSDGSISVGASAYFWNHVTRLFQPEGVNPSDFYRLFLIPGMQHCSGNVNSAPWYIAGANQAGSLSGNIHSVPGYDDENHDALLALMAWIENGTAPSSVIGTKYVEDDPEQGVMMQRPLCPYPQEAK